MRPLFKNILTISLYRDIIIVQGGVIVPVLSRFYGIIIRMYFLQSEHNPPHIHAIYNEDVAAIDFMTGDVIEGDLPPKALAMVREWIGLHKDELKEMWETQDFRKIEPLE